MDNNNQKKRALGKGLEQLFSNERLDFDQMEHKIVNETDDKDIKDIPLSEIRSNPYQPRKSFDEQALNELASSIKEHGVVQPIIVKKSIKGYEIIAGERRTKASLIAGKTTIPAIIRDFNDQEMMEIALIENIQRENLNPIEEAKAFKTISETYNYTQDDLSIKFGKSRSYVTNLLGLLRLPDNIQDMINDHKLTMGHARVISKLSNEDEMLELANKVITEKLSVRDIEQETSLPKYKKYSPIKRTVENDKYRIYENTMREKIGTKVKISSKKIEIPFDSEKDLERILEIIDINID